MSIPAFLDTGLLPVGVHVVEDISEVESVLAWNDRRKLLVKGLRDFVSRELALCAHGLELCVDGSFVTNKPVPGDIDICICVSSEDFDSRGALVDLIKRDGGKNGRVRATYGVEPVIGLSWLASRDHLSYFQRLSVREAFARRIEPTTRKGIVKVQKWASG